MGYAGYFKFTLNTQPTSGAFIAAELPFGDFIQVWDSNGNKLPPLASNIFLPWQQAARDTTTASLNGCPAGTFYVYVYRQFAPSTVKLAISPAGYRLATPTNVNVTNQMETNIRLQWDHMSNATNYVIERSLNGINGWTSLGYTSTGVYWYNDTTGLVANTTYYYRVASVHSQMITGTGNGVYQSEWSPIVQASTSGQSTHPMITMHPQSATYTQGQTADTLTITATGNGTLSYQWYKVGNAALLATTQTYTPSTATAGSEGYYCVVTNTLGETSKTTTSSTATITVNSTTGSDTIPKPPGTGAKPVKVSGIKKTNISLSTATISWKANAKNTFYEVVCTSHPGVDKVELLGNTVTFAGLNPKTSYKFKIISYNGETVAKKVAKVSVKTKTYAAPKGIKKTSTSDSITLTWKSSPFPETDRYEVICKDKKGNVVYPAGDPNIVVIGTSATISNLNSKTSYKFEIVAVSDLLGGLKSKVAKVSVKTKK
jgi:hypothetical protein